MRRGYGATAFIGGADYALDGINGNILNYDDVAFVVNSTGVFHYVMTATDTAENVPYSITPDLNSTSKRWILTSVETLVHDVTQDAGHYIITDKIRARAGGNTYLVNESDIGIQVTSGGRIIMNGPTDVTSLNVSQTLGVTGSSIFQGTSTFLDTVFLQDQLSSSVSAGTPPFIIGSDALVTNLNADKLDGYHETAFIFRNGSRDFSGTVGGVYPTSGGHLATKEYVDDQIVGSEWKDSVLDKDLTTAPVGPPDGTRYLVPSGATGVWSTHVDEIAQFDTSIPSWTFSGNPSAGWAVWVDDEESVYYFTGTVWKSMAAVTHHGGLAGLGDDDHTQYLLADGTRDISAIINTSDINTVGNINVSNDLEVIGTGTFLDLVTEDLEVTVQSLFTSGSVSRFAGSFIVSGNPPSANSADFYAPATFYGNAYVMSRLGVRTTNPIVDLDVNGYMVLESGLPVNTITDTISASAPSSGALVTENGIVDYVEAQFQTGSVSASAASGSDSLLVNFGTPFADTNYSIVANLVNTSTLPVTAYTPSIFPFVINRKYTTGFAILFSGALDSLDYAVDYVAQPL